ncbi:MAG: roadblock/LC7 domain-containing protein [Gemmatimonadaceae bacterium]
MTAPARVSPFRATLLEVMKQRGLLGALIVDAVDGIPIESTLAVGVDGDAVAALAASLFDHACRAAAAANYGDGTYFQLQAEHGWLCVTGAGALVLAAVAEPRANVALLRLSLLRARTALVP